MSKPVDAAPRESQRSSLAFVFCLLCFCLSPLIFLSTQDVLGWFALAYLSGLRLVLPGFDADLNALVRQRRSFLRLFFNRYTATCLLLGLGTILVGFLAERVPQQGEMLSFLVVLEHSFEHKPLLRKVLIVWLI